MRTVTGQAGEGLRFLITFALVHLLDVPDDGHLLVRRLQFIVLNELAERQARAKIKRRLPLSRCHGAAAQMTLVADRFRKLSRQAGRIDDGVVEITRGWFRRSSCRDIFLPLKVQLPRTVALLA